MYINDEPDMVVAFTVGAYNARAEAGLYSLMRNRILPVVIE
jgi:hypothetical protein